MGTILERIKPSLGKHHSLIIITASTEMDWLIHLLSLKKRGVLPTVMLMSQPDKSVTAILEHLAVAYHHIPHGMVRRPEQNNLTKSNRWHITTAEETTPFTV